MTARFLDDERDFADPEWANRLRTAQFESGSSDSSPLIISAFRIALHLSEWLAIDVSDLHKWV